MTSTSGPTDENGENGGDGEGNGARRAAKSPDAFRTISEVAADLDVPQHVLRFWETKFGQIRPLKRGGGRRYYRPEDVQLLRRIRQLLYSEGYTIKGVQKVLRESSRATPEPGRGGGEAEPAEAAEGPGGETERRHLQGLLDDLCAARELLRKYEG